MNPNFQTAIDEAQKCIKRQKTCATKSDAALDSMIRMVKAAQQELEANPDDADPEATLTRLQKSIEDAGLTKELNSATKEFHTSIAKLGKALEKAVDMDADVCRVLRPCPAAAADPGLLARLVAEHAYRGGRFGLGDCVAAEAGLMDAEELRAPHAAVHEVLEQIRCRNLGPALAWAESHRPALSPDGGPSAFEFRLHSLNFVHTLKTQGRTAALSYAKAHFAQFASRHLPDIQRLMGCLVFADRRHSAGSSGGGGTPSTAAAAAQDGAAGGSSADGGGSSGGGGGTAAVAAPPGSSSNPYADLLSPSGWDAAAREFARQACSLMGQASESPLTTVAAAGAVALPALLKMAAKMEEKKQDLRTVDELPVEIQLGPSFVFRSIFACPVSRDMARPDNPPTLLPCGHVLSHQSCALLAKGRGRGFKCPYCPLEARLEALRPLTFPGLD